MTLGEDGENKEPLHIIVDPQLTTAVRPQSGNHNFVVFDRNDKARHGAMAMEREIQVMSPGICFGLELLVIIVV